MSPQADQMFADALRLSDKDRGELAARLIESLDPAEDDAVEAAWGLEIQERIAQLQSGQIQSIAWPNARRMILEDSDDSDAP